MSEPQPAWTLIPEQMREQPQRWAVWRYEVRGGKPTKVPHQLNGYGADATDPEQWSDYVSACDYLSKHQYDGLSFRLGEGWAGVDLDGSRDPEGGTLHPYAEEIIEQLDSYTEVSPSGTGVKIFLVAEAIEGMTTGRNTTNCPITKVELYTGKRFFTVTGQQCWRTGPIEDFAERTPELQALWSELFPPVIPQRADRRVVRALSGSDDQILSKMLSYPKIKRLWEGDTAAYGGDDSAADLAMCDHLRFWLGPDPQTIDRWFRMSGLMRDKWDSQHGELTYGVMTVNTSLNGEVRKAGFSGPVSV